MTLDCSLTIDDAPEAVTFTLAVTNGGVDVIEVVFRDAGRAEFVVSADGIEHWRWSEGRMFAQVRETIELAPGETFDVTGAWNDPAPGTYELEAELRADPSCRVRTEFSV